MPAAKRTTAKQTRKPASRSRRQAASRDEEPKVEEPRVGSLAAADAPPLAERLEGTGEVDPATHYWGGTPVSATTAATDAAAEHKAMAINGTAGYILAADMHSTPG